VHFVCLFFSSIGVYALYIFYTSRTCRWGSSVNVYNAM